MNGFEGISDIKMERPLKVLKANGPRYLVRVLEEEVTPGGIVLAQNGAAQKLQRGTVINAGASFEQFGYRHLTIYAGEEVLFLSEHALSVPGDSTARVVRDEHVVGVFREEDLPLRPYDVRLGGKASKVV